MWLICEKEEKSHILAVNKIIKDVMSREKEEEYKGRDKLFSHHSLSHNVKWQEENKMSASDILVLKRLQEKVYRCYSRSRNKRKPSSFTPLK